MASWMNTPKRPCGTIAAYKRHLRHREPACPACLQAQARYRRPYPTRTMDGALPDLREIRNGFPEFRPYIYRGTGRDAYDGTCAFEEAP